MTPPPAPGSQAARPRAWRRQALVIAKLALAVVLVAWLLRSGRLDLGAYAVLLDGPMAGMLVGVLVLQALSFAVFIARWRGLVRVQDLDVGWPDVMRTGAQGLFTQLFVPGGLGTDGLRILYIHRAHGGKLAAGISSVAADRVVGVVSLALLGAGAALIQVMSSGPALRPIAIVNGLALLAVVLALAAAAWLIAHPVPRLARLQARVAPLADAMRRYGSQRAAVGTALLVSMLGHLLTCAATALCLAALGADTLPVPGLIAVVCAVNLVRMVPLTPMGLGVTDGAAEALFALIGIPLGAEQQMLQRALSVLIFLVSGLSFLRRAR